MSRRSISSLENGQSRLGESNEILQEKKKNDTKNREQGVEACKI